MTKKFADLAKQDESITAKCAKLFGVSINTFCNWRWQMKNQIQDRKEAEKIISLLKEEQSGFETLNELFHIGVTPYYLGLIALGKDKAAIRRQALPSQLELSDHLGQQDPLDEVGHSPVKEVVHLYPDRVAFCVAQLCPVYCRYCFRKRRDSEKGLHFNRNIIKNGIDYISSNKAIKDVLITGGDPFIASDQAIEGLLQQLSAIEHVEVVRFGTRTPVTLPYRVTKTLANILAKYHPVWLNTHFNSAEEITVEASLAISNLVDAGIPVGNQAVLLKGVNDSDEKMKELCLALVKNRVRPYYVFHPHMVEGTKHLRVPVSKGLSIMKSLRGNISGFAIPTYALDTPSGKIPLSHNYILGYDGNDILVEGIRGEIWREVGAEEP
ncbi:MAG: KamA family radical SAM protein [Bdellovibrionota bacterium]